MKHFNNLTFTDLLPVIVSTVLILPNMYISILSSMSAIECAAQLTLPFAMYMMIMSSSDNTPRTSLLLFPMMFFAAFQIVVSYLYNDGAPIGVDMFLNVWTTNMTEVDELLSGIALPVIFVVAAYLPLTVAAIMMWRRRRLSARSKIKLWRRTALVLAAAGMTACVWCITSQPGYEVHTRLFPVNVFYNLKEAVERQYHMAHYPDMSAQFRYGATSWHKDDKELYVAVIGETSRADNWQIMGYRRATNPLLSKYGDRVIAFGKVYSESNTTHKSVPMLLSTLSAENYEEGIFSHRSIITAFREAGFYTYFLSVQSPNHSMIESYAREAHTLKYASCSDGKHAIDGNILPMVDATINDNTHKKKLIVVHLYGSHFDYTDRYPSEYALFKPDRHRQVNAENRARLINAYDNTIVYTDYVLSEMIHRLDEAGCSAGLIYTSDHGEDIFDDGSGKFLHASPTPTYWQLHVPMLLYMNKPYTDEHADLYANAKKNSTVTASSSKSYAHTLLHMAGIKTPYTDVRQSLLNNDFKPLKKLYYLTDLDEAVDIKEIGVDIERKTDR